MKFNKELKECKDNNILKVANYLASRDDIKNNLEKENKSLKEMWQYIMSQARQMAKGGSICVDDETVYAWAVHYYDEDNLKVDKVNSIQSKESNIEKNEPKAKPAVKEDVKEEVAAKPKKKKKVNDVHEEQISIFDLM